ncbi:MAG TPA: DUF362 domain-containing protein [Pyrinomonadaceae bacterium]|nr:DUF362 domain-containing protein [Pyrinomonadaceae bacterium]
MLESPIVSAFSDPLVGYPEAPPFHPDQEYPEYCLAGQACVSSANGVYGAVRESLALLGLDAEHFGSRDWNPLKMLVQPGANVVIKPNAVMDINMNRGESVFASITHGSVLRAVVDYVYKALGGRGRIVIADAPLAHSDFDNWVKVTGIQAVVDLYRERLGFEIPVLDLRNLYVPWDYDLNYAPSHLRVREVRDPAGYVEVDLNGDSEFTGFSTRDVRLMYGSDFKREQTVRHHLNGHRYYVAKTVLDSDVFISVPKLKVHQKVGVTLNIKGMVGTQGDKNYIPHHRIGSPSRGGDEHPDLGLLQNTLNRYRMWLYTGLLAHENRAADLAYKVLGRLHRAGQSALDRRGWRKYGDQYLGNIVGGSWHGNDTAWRMALDLTRIVLHADREGQVCREPQRKFFSVIDGIVGGEKEGPLAPTAKSCGVILAGFNPLAVDAVASRLMGLDPLKIKMLAEGLQRDWLKLWEGGLTDIPVRSNFAPFRSVMSNASDPFLNFQLAKGWRGHVELRGA